MTITDTGLAAKTGTIYCSSWGYDQTNIDFYEVVAATAKTVQLRPIRSRCVEVTGELSEYVEPVPGDYNGEPFRRKVLTYARGAVAINGYTNAYPWDGRPRHATHYA
ncbi:hypothetical protein [Tersicoccus sp. Bi-70]|uniref:hypothetical protein n=1 Tax=Tersicoccus sp. Bi-70 TaxID=1897634 RepID=UPI00097638BF|nr:hypothetical protein [Tersicoccus sp. Bi-70]OMH34807.1 hypothetical protein BGP79_00015 [Tersicoccus sp. Bi-70]